MQGCLSFDAGFFKAVLGFVTRMSYLRLLSQSGAVAGVYNTGAAGQYGGNCHGGKDGDFFHNYRPFQLK